MQLLLIGSKVKNQTENIAILIIASIDCLCDIISDPTKSIWVTTIYCLSF